MPASKTVKKLRCNGCGQMLIKDEPFLLDGEVYCSDCYNRLIVERQKTEEEKKSLYEYIKSVFGVTECPPDVVSFINWATEKKGYKLSGIRATLYYYYEIEGKNPGDPEEVRFIVPQQYEAARSYFIEMENIREKNDKVRLDNVKTNVIHLKKSPESRRKHFGYKMEDL